jgi:hypothetical protein
MRIAFCGASGTGKTTLAEYVAKKYRLEMNPIGSRSVAKDMGFESPYDADKARRRAEFQRRLVDSKREWEAAHESFVTDRTTFDNLTYMALHDVYSATMGYLQNAVFGVQRYTHIIYCPVKAFFAVNNDPMRIKEQDYHIIYDVLLHGFLTRYCKRPVITLSASDLAERKATVDAFLHNVE